MGIGQIVELIWLGIMPAIAAGISLWRGKKWWTILAIVLVMLSAPASYYGIYAISKTVLSNLSFIQFIFFPFPLAVILFLLFLKFSPQSTNKNK